MVIHVGHREIYPGEILRDLSPSKDSDEEMRMSNNGMLLPSYFLIALQIKHSRPTGNRVNDFLARHGSSSTPHVQPNYSGANSVSDPPIDYHRDGDIVTLSHASALIPTSLISRCCIVASSLDTVADGPRSPCWKERDFEV